jgi:hypothetical protein
LDTILAGQTTKGTSPLKPATYLVRAVAPMSNVDIVSSVSAHIGRAGVYDDDQDRVLTREIVTFTTNPIIIDPASIVETDSFLEHARGSGIVFRGGHWVDRNGNRLRIGPATGDVMVLGVWFAAMIAALACLVLLRMTYGKRIRRADKKGGTPR